MQWVKFVGSFNHSVFKSAKNKLFPSYTITVDKNPAAGDFTTIQDAIDSLPSVNIVRVVIKVHAGVYTEKVNIPPLKSFITIEGSGANETIVQWGDTAQHLVREDNLWEPMLLQLFPTQHQFHQREQSESKQWHLGYQQAQLPFKGVNSLELKRLSTITWADITTKIATSKVRLISSSTTVSPSSSKAVKLRASGCNLKPLLGKKTPYFGCHVHAVATLTGAVTAQGRGSILDDTGFSFVNCKVTGSGALYLGRAWGPFSRVVFAYTYMDNIIIPKGWYNWGDPAREMTVFYGQYKCMGRGASFAEGFHGRGSLRMKRLSLLFS
ncbi:putative pectinesterase 53 [Hibiscus syriacus]|uniref:pectinesterase n=1 Tax=Hibiscus syriacus TaxID=106335 RepID=A0A6A2Y3Q2_HIBSY|nr:putative pectinesterase 53 [Hibiscus syriacus]